MSIYEFDVKTIDNEEIKLEEYKREGVGNCEYRKQVRIYTTI